MLYEFLILCLQSLWKFLCLQSLVLSSSCVCNFRPMATCKRMYQQALDAIRQAAPGSASDPVLATPFRGSRKERQRFSYTDTSYAGFVELLPGHLLTVEAYKDLLKRVPGVHSVIKHTKGTKVQTVRGIITKTRISSSTLRTTRTSPWI